MSHYGVTVPPSPFPRANIPVADVLRLLLPDVVVLLTAALTLVINIKLVKASCKTREDQGQLSEVAKDEEGGASSGG